LESSLVFVPLIKQAMLWTANKPPIPYMAYNLAKVENKLAGNKTFSLYDIKVDYINQNYLETIITT
jgi:hypothetical protein